MVFLFFFFNQYTFGFQCPIGGLQVVTAQTKAQDGSIAYF